MSGANHGNDKRRNRPSEAEMLVALCKWQFETLKLHLRSLSFSVLS